MNELSDRVIRPFNATTEGKMGPYWKSRMRDHGSYLAGLGLTVMMFTCGAAADTLPLSIAIDDLTDTPSVTVLQNGVSTPGNCAVTLEHAACSFLFPSGTLGTTLIRGIAALSEAPGENEGGTGTISDEVRLSVIPGTPNDALILTFESDRPGFAFVDGLGAIAVAELATGNLLLGQSTNHFFDTTTFQPVQMPSGITISVKSDVVPEPSSLLLLASVLAGIAVRGVVRRLSIVGRDHQQDFAGGEGQRDTYPTSDDVPVRH